MQRLLITEYATRTVDVSRTYVLVLVDGETAADYTDEIAQIEWQQKAERFDVWDDLTSVENATQSDLDRFEVVGTDWDALNAELEEIAVEEEIEIR